MGQILYMAEELFDTLINDDELARDVTCYHLHCRPTSSAVSSNVFQCGESIPLGQRWIHYYYYIIIYIIHDIVFEI